MQKKKYQIEVGGRILTAIFSDLAAQTNGSVMLRYGETIVLATVCMSPHKRTGIDFFPLVVDYEEKFYAAGEILGGQFVRREGRPSEEAILTSRFIDRTIRPLFPQTMRNDVQVVITTLSVDEENEPGLIGILASSLALLVSDIPWKGPVGACRIGWTKEKGFEINPRTKDKETLSADILVAGKGGLVNMIEAEAKEIPENIAEDAFNIALKEISHLETFQSDIAKEIGKEKKGTEENMLPEGAQQLFETAILPRLSEAMFETKGKKGVGSLKEEWGTLFENAYPEHETDRAHMLFDEKVDEIIHREALENDRRPDGRRMDEVRGLQAEAGGLSPVLHGAGLFQRGETHVLSVLTLGGPKDSLLIDGMEVRTRKYFMHHYNFPPFSSGEVGRMGGLNRRAIGHGALAEKAIQAILPSRDTFPYTIRIVSETMSSNGSTSMASVCASSLALMDGGVPIKRPCAGIAMGLMMESRKSESPAEGEARQGRQKVESQKYRILTDIQGPEDHHGDMDFKVAGTREGICAIQLDVKVDGVSTSILSEAMQQSKKARIEIIDVIEKAIPEPRKELLPSAPKIIKLQIPVDKIGQVIGPGGKVINQIIEQSGGAEIEIEQDGSIFITGKNGTSEKARAMVEELVREYKVGDRFTGKVTRIVDFGAFVQISPTTEGLVHISEMAPFRIDKVSSVLTRGEQVPVVIREIDEKGRINLSIKMVDPDFIKNKGGTAA